MDNLECRPVISEVLTIHDGDKLQVVWEDGHTGTFSKEWLHGRKFEMPSRDVYRKLFQIPKVFKDNLYINRFRTHVSV